MKTPGNTEITFTIFITCFNKADFIVGCLRSALNQKYTSANFSVFIYDDASWDSSPEIIEGFISGLAEDERDRIELVRGIENIGPLKATLDLVPKTKGNYTILLDGDDELHSDCLKVLMRKIAIFPPMYGFKLSMASKAEKASSASSVESSSDIVIVPAHSLLSQFKTGGAGMCAPKKCFSFECDFTPHVLVQDHILPALLSATLAGWVEVKNPLYLFEDGPRMGNISAARPQTEHDRLAFFLFVVRLSHLKRWTRVGWLYRYKLLEKVILFNNRYGQGRSYILGQAVVGLVFDRILVKTVSLIMCDIAKKHNVKTFI